MDEVDNEHVFGQDGGLIEQVFPLIVAATTREVNRMRARVLAIVLVVAGFLLVVPGLARGDGPERPAPRVTYVVEQGDTLWSIARRVAPGRDPRPVVDGLIEANDVRGGLQAGQELSIPVPER
ncbi:MAG TPA: LysM peptidoglycan-binding domain-containing protein [Actinomycetota bacterium]|nr:LysM peptidoglycan-binding domain-containing protein [Actinomycetota bacterium]